MYNPKIKDTVQAMINEIGMLRETGIALDQMPEELIEIRVKLHTLYQKLDVEVKTYSIYRNFIQGGRELLHSGVTLEEAKSHCKIQTLHHELQPCNQKK